MNKLLLMIGAAAMVAPLMSSADGYQFIVSGDPVAAAAVSASTSASSGTALVTSARTSPTAAAALGARYRTIDEADGIALRTDEFKGMVITIK